ncbi:MAG: leucine-rich repeat protein [Ruminococcus sp.]|nr:leucine-rich repeat protein [Ruminococcus sp.]
MKTGIKKTIAFALTLCAITAGTIAPDAGKFTLSPTPIVAEAAVKSGDFTFTRRSTNAATLTSYIGSKTSVTLPTSVTINGAVCKVTGVDDEAFFRNGNIRSVTIPEGYTSIGNRAFMNCSSLSYVSVPSTMAGIRNRAFEGTAITSINIPSKVKILDSYVFTRCSQLRTVNITTNLLTEYKEGLFCGCSSLKSIKIPSSVKKLGDSFAYGCSSLTSVTIPSSVTSIASNAFSQCTNLSSVSLPSSVTEFGSDVFKDTKWIKNQPKTNGMVIKNGYILDASSASGTVTIPSYINKILPYTFAYNTKITKVVMPTALNTLGNGAFLGCSGLSSIVLPTSIANFGESVFSDCTNLTSVQLPNYIAVIPKYTFSNCKKLSSIVLPSRIQTIDASAFANCTSLKTVTFPERLQTIGNGAFRNCSSLSDIKGVKESNNYTIDGMAFADCLNLKKINGTTIVYTSGNNVYLNKELFVKKYFSKTDDIGFIQDYVDKKAQAVVNQIKSKYPNYNYVQIARELENWMCANGCNPYVDWERKNKNQDYPNALAGRPEYHLESSVLMNGVGVCEGFAKGYNLLLTKAGISAEIVLSKTHAWNVIKAEGKLFNIDSYWDDGGNNSVYNWFMVSDSEMDKMDDTDAHDKNQIERKSNRYIYEYKDMPCTTPMGDVNVDGKLDKTDVQWLQSYLNTGRNPANSFNHIFADMNFDGKLNATDLSLLKQKILNNK